MRARIKQLDDTAPQPCCDRARDYMLKNQGIVVKLTGTPYRFNGKCLGCGNISDYIVYAVPHQEFTNVAIGYIDIEEGS